MMFMPPLCRGGIVRRIFAYKGTQIQPNLLTVCQEKFYAMPPMRLKGSRQGSA